MSEKTFETQSPVRARRKPETARMIGIVSSDPKLNFDIKDRGRKLGGNKLDSQKLARYEAARRKIRDTARDFAKRLTALDGNTKLPIEQYLPQKKTAVRVSVPLREMVSSIEKAGGWDKFIALLMHLPEQESSYNPSVISNGNHGLYQFRRPTWNQAINKYQRALPGGVFDVSQGIMGFESQVRVAFLELMGYVHRFNGSFAAALAGWNQGPNREVLNGMGYAKGTLGETEKQVLAKNASKLGRTTAEYVNNVLFRIGVIDADVVSGTLRPRIARRRVPIRKASIPQRA